MRSRPTYSSHLRPFAAGLALLLGLPGCVRSPRGSSDVGSSDASTRASTPEPGSQTTPEPWALPPPPPKGVYDGRLFALSHDYPTEPVEPPVDPPWRVAIDHGRIDTGNASAYAEALKDYVASRGLRTLLFDYDRWDPEQAGWFNVPWLADVREPIRGTYVGSSFPAAMFPRSGLREPMTTHVLVYYDRVAASGVLQGLWGPSGMNPVPGIDRGAAQYPEGSVIIKTASTTADASTWPPMEGAQPWTIYAPPGAGTKGAPELQTVQLFQVDIIVKDSASSPRTQWVFTTLVYDEDAPGDSAWDKLVPLGAIWGADTDVVSPQGCDPIAGECPPLEQTWINPEAPLYAKETLGWGGRLAGPNDGAVDIDAAVLRPDGSSEPYEGRYAMSSCMSCHGSAEYPMDSFLLPVPATCPDDVCQPATDPQGRLTYYATGSTEFMQWFQDRSGNEPMNPGSASIDFGMNNAFKAIPTWYADVEGGATNFVDAFNDYRGRALASD